LYFFSAAVIVFLPVFAGFAAVADACRAGLALETGTMAPPGERTIAPPREGAAAGAADFLARGFFAAGAAAAAGVVAFLALGFAAGAAVAAFFARGFGAGFSRPATGILAPPLTPRVPSNRVT
jgi:hypothetical protein